MDAQNTAFFKNKGQWNNAVQYQLALEHGHLWVVNNGLVFNYWSAEVAEKMHTRSTENIIGNAHAIFLEFKGANFNKVIENKQTTYYCNYFYGNNPKNWVSGLYGSTELLYTDIYPGVNLRLMHTEQGFKYDIIVENASALNQVNLVYHGAKNLNLIQNQLHIQTSIGNYTEQIPLAWFETSNKDKELVNVNYTLQDSTIKFSLSKSFKRKSKLIIDPKLEFSTFSGSRADNFGCTATYTESGETYSGGTVFGIGFPVTFGAYQLNFRGGENTGAELGYGGARDAGILKFSKNGSNLLWATYLGGSNNEQPHSMVSDSFGNIYIMGSTASLDFPTENALDATFNGDYDFFITKISSNGNSVMASTFFGGNGLDAVGAFRNGFNINTFPLLYNYADEFRGEVILHNNNVLVAGVSYSSDFPFTQGSFASNSQAVVFSLSNNLSALNWSHILGGGGFDQFYGLAAYKDLVYATGSTSSFNLNTDVLNVINSFNGGISDGILAKFNANDGAILKLRYVGTTAYDQSYFVQLDNAGKPYIYGITEGSMPVVKAFYNQPNKGQFITRLNADLDTIELSANIGGTNSGPNLSPTAFLVDRCERIFISGWGGKTNDNLSDQTGDKVKRNRGTTLGLPITADAVQNRTDGSDFYLAVFAQDLSNLLYATYFGGINQAGGNVVDEHVDGGTSRFDKKGIIYQAVCGGCQRNGRFPTSINAYSRNMLSNNCNNAVFKIDFENLNRKPFMKDTFIKVIATQNINWSTFIKDLDYGDEISYKTEVISKGGLSNSNFPTYSITNAQNPSTFYPPGPLQGVKAIFNINWQTNCKSFSTDTFILKITIYDKGCPSQDSNFAFIKILILPPPIVIPPESVCLNFNRATNELNISWKSTIQNMDFFKQFELRIDEPSGNTKTELVIPNTNSGNHKIILPTDPFTQDYCFYMVGINKCDSVVFPKNKYCTIRELNFPINGVPLSYVTTEMDKQVKITWLTSNEPDFNDYEIYKANKNELQNFKLWERTKDTQLIDASFNVDNESYCYKVVVTDKCGRASKPSSEHCNIVITGTEVGNPQYLFNLSWMPYSFWQNGVNQYQLEFRNDIEDWRQGEQTQNTIGQNVTDNYDWGGYWFRVKAKSNNAVETISESNWIYLIHQPEMWVPSAFSPNKNGTNDLWGFVPVYAKTFSMKVYNRYGEKIWQTENKKNQWDGNINNTQAPAGVYAWLLTFTSWDGKEFQMSGTVTVIR